MSGRSPRGSAAGSRLLLAALAFATAPALGQTLHERIDAAIQAASPAGRLPVASDADFLRRVYLDLVGTIPSSTEARAFLDDPAPEKRTALVDRLLADPRFARQMADLLDVMFMERRPETHVKAAEWKQYLRDSIAAGKPLHELAREILAADGVDPKARPAARFILDRSADPNLVTRDLGRIFFGRDMQCAQCHDHPHIDDYSQADYYGLQAFVNRTFVFDDKPNKIKVLAEKADGDVAYQSVFDPAARGTTLPRAPGGQDVAEPALLVGDEYAVRPAADVRPIPKHSRRAALAAEVGSGHNVHFNRNLANRLWAMLMGRGIVEPVDLHHSDNPPTHPELLQLLTDELVASGFNLRTMVRELALSETYQRSLELPADVAPQAATAAAPLAALESERQQLAAQLAQDDAAVKAIYDRLKPARQAIVPLLEELSKVKTPWQQARTAVEQATTAVATSQQQLATKQNVLRTVSEAAAKADEAAKQLTDSKELRQAADLLLAKSQQLTTESATLTKTLAEQTTASQAAVEKLAAAQKPIDEVNSRLLPAKAPVDAVQQEYAAAMSKWLAGRTVAVRLDRRLTAQRALVAFQAAQTTALASQQSAEQSTAALASVRNAGQTSDAALEVATQQAQAKAATDRKAADAARETLTAAWTQQFAVGALEPLSPEQLAWSILQAAGVTDNQRLASRAALDKSQPLDPATQNDPAVIAQRTALVESQTCDALQGNTGLFVNLFAAAPGQPQTDFFATVDQALFFANGPQVRGWIAPGGQNLTARLQALPDNRAVAEELYLSVLTRRPTDAETADVDQYLTARMAERPAGLQELVWALLTSAEFRFSH